MKITISDKSGFCFGVKRGVDIADKFLTENKTVYSLGHMIHNKCVIEKFEEKGRNYTLQDRINLIQLNRKIIKQIIPTFKKYQNEGKIEILTSPYHHPIVPILINPKDLKFTNSK